MKARVHVFVSGRVQGVFFRDHTRRWAVSLGLGGWVRNLEDGRVEVTAEGDQRSLEELVARLRLGPPAAAVEEAEAAWEEFRGEFDGFRIVWS